MFKYLSDVEAHRSKQADVEACRWAKENAKLEKFKIRTDIDSRIGALMSAKGVRYYAYVNGVYHESTVENLTNLLTGK